MDCLHDKLTTDAFGVWWICANKKCDATIGPVTDQLTIFNYEGV